jgi:hypothetical protein
MSDLIQTSLSNHIYRFTWFTPVVLTVLSTLGSYNLGWFELSEFEPESCFVLPQ